MKETDISADDGELISNERIARDESVGVRLGPGRERGRGKEG